MVACASCFAYHWLVPACAAVEQLVLQPIKHIEGHVKLPGSKSLSNRILLLAALSEGSTEVQNLLVGSRKVQAVGQQHRRVNNRPLHQRSITSSFFQLQDSEDIRLMVGALKDLGVELEEDWHNDKITVHGCAGRFPVEDVKLYLGNAGTAMRYAFAAMRPSFAAVAM